MPKIDQTNELQSSGVDDGPIVHKYRNHSSGCRARMTSLDADCDRDCTLEELILMSRQHSPECRATKTGVDADCDSGCVSTVIVHKKRNHTSACSANETGVDADCDSGCRRDVVFLLISEGATTGDGPIVHKKRNRDSDPNHKEAEAE